MEMELPADYQNLASQRNKPCARCCNLAACRILRWL